MLGFVENAITLLNRRLCFFDLVTGKGAYAPRKHTVLVQPGGTVSWDVTGEEGDWAFHCHMLYHMHAGMMRVVQVRKAGEAAA